MRLYRFSPIANDAELYEAVMYLHQTCHKLCLEATGRYLPTSGNIGVFAHFSDEFEKLTLIRKALTTAVNYHQKYFELKEPIHISEKEGVPAATYEFLYIRKPDPYRSQVGDVDFVMSESEHAEFKAGLTTDTFTNSARIFERPEHNMIELWDPSLDVLSYVVTERMRDKL